MGAVLFAGAALVGWCAAAAGDLPLAGRVAPPSAADPAVEAAWSELETSRRHPWLRWPDLDDVAHDLSALRAGEADGLVWFDGSRPVPALLEAADLLAAAGDLGLDPRDFDAELVERRARGLAAGALLAARERVLLDAAVSTGVLRLLEAASRGRAVPRRAGMVGSSPPRGLDLPGLVREGRDGGRLRSLAASVEPRYPGYARLRAALARYRALALRPALAGVPGPGARPGDAWEGAAALRARLVALGDLEPGPVPDDPARYSEDLALAVKRFQDRHGLSADGVLGRRTLAELNVPPDRRARQLALSMERYRWLPSPGTRVILVEVPRAELWALDLATGEPGPSMRAVVGGSDEHQTPMLCGEVRSVVFRPYWVPTPQIVREEILPRERSRPGWLAAHGMELVPRGAGQAEPVPPSEENLALVRAGRLSVRQRPGPGNDLGAVKFVMPNPECIAIHGTPHPQLFERPRRDRSHGCIRVEEPAALAGWVLRDEAGWGPDRIAAAMRRAQPSEARLARPVPVVILYATASVDPDGRVQFRDDLYGLDALLERELARRPEPR